ncbi:MAG: hypothetical protein ACW99A_13385 [Candidatus Kariarchaeaceae archaeon]|jgi:hypothetical protein
MWLFQNSGFVALIIFAINIIFMMGFYFGKIKSFVSKTELKDMLDKKIREEVDGAIEDHCPFVDKLKEFDNNYIEHIIDKRVEAHPLIQKFRVTDFVIRELVPDVKQIREDIQNIKITLAKINGKK